MTRLRIVLALVLAASTGCGGSGADVSTLPRAPSVRSAREHARAHPNDPAAQRALAELEILAPDGDPANVPAALEQALALAPDDAVLHLLRSIWRGQHGELDGADEDDLATIELARASNDRLAPFAAELAADELSLDVGAAAEESSRLARARAIFAAPGRVGPLTIGSLGDALLDDALQRGQADEARGIARSMGCLESYHVAGPFGPREQLGFDHEFPAAGLGPMAESYDLGPLRGVRPVREIHAKGCSIWLGGGAVAEPGTSYAESFVDVPAAGDAFLVLSTPNSVIVRVDGREVARLDRRDAPRPRVSLHPIHLTAGRHEIEVKITSRHPSPVLSLRLVGGDGLAFAAGSPAYAAGEMPRGSDATSLYLRSRLAQMRGDVVEAREALRGLFDGESASTTVLVHHASLLFADPLMPQDRATDLGRAALRAIAEHDAGNWLPTLRLAELAADEGRVDEAVDGLRAAEARFPEVVAIELTLVGLLQQRGFTAEAERRLRALAESHPANCGVLSTQRQLAASMARTVAAAGFAEALVRCNARSTTRLDLLMTARDWDGAEREIERLEGLELDGDVSGFYPARLSLARARHDAAAEAAIIDRIRARWPRADGPVLADVDARVAGGDFTGAIAALDAAVAQEPASFAGLRTLRGALARQHAMEPYRLDGLQAIADYRASDVSYDAPAVYVLDYAAARIFPDGSYLYLVHQVIEVNSEEALDEVGEFHPPEGELLRLRTIKRDGRILEPDVIAGMPSLALPQLEVGDFVEYEYVLSEGPSEALEGGVLSHRFYFRSFDGPLHRTEYLVITPSGLDVDFDRRGPLPEPQIEQQGDVRLVRYRMDRQAKPEPEPFSVNAREYMPSVSWGIRARWDAFRDMLADRVADTMQRDPALARATEQVIREAHARTPREKAVALFHWVQENVEGDGNGLFESAPGMLYDRSGNRDRVLQYVLRLAGIESELVLVRSVDADQTESPLPEDDTYDAYVLRASLGDERVFLTAAQRGVPFGWLPSGVLGQPGLVVAQGGESLRLPARSPVADERRIAIDAILEEGGTAVLTVTETFTGASAGSWRNDLEQVPAAELELRFESGYVAPRFPGGTLRSLEVIAMDDVEQPFVLRYVVEAPIGFPDGAEMVLALPMPFELGGALAATATRETIAQIPSVTTRYAMTVQLPSTLQASNLPQPVEIPGPAGSTFHASVRVSGSRLEIARELELRRGRVSPEQYVELARFARSCDREEARPIRLRSR